MRRPAFTRSGLAHLVSMNALDQKLPKTIHCGCSISKKAQNAVPRSPPLCGICGHVMAVKSRSFANPSLVCLPAHFTGVGRSPLCPPPTNVAPRACVRPKCRKRATNTCFVCPDESAHFGVACLCDDHANSDGCHVFKGWALRRPAFTRSGLAHLVSMNALDQKCRCMFT